MNSLPDRSVLPVTTIAAGWTMPNRTPAPWRSVMARPWLAVSVALLVAIIGLTAALLFGHASYVAEATVRVAPSSPTQFGRGDNAFNFGSGETYRDFVQQQVYEIGSYGTMLAALNQLGAKRGLWQRPGETDRHAAERMMEALRINAIPDSYFITVDLEAENPQGLADIVNAAVNAYLAREAGQEVNGTDQGEQVLASRKGELEQRMTTDQDQLNQLAQTLGIASIDGVGANPYDKLLADENDALAKAHRNVLLADAHLAAIKAHQGRIEQLEIDSKTHQMVTADPETATAKQQLLQQREAAFLELSGLGPNHPARPALEQKIAGINAEIKSLDKAATQQISESLRASEGAKSDVTVSQAEATLDQAQRAEQGIQKDLEDLRSNATVFGAKYTQGIALHDKLERERKELQDIEDQMSYLRVAQRAPGYISLDSPAMTPDLPQKGRRRKIFILFALAALGLAVGVPTGLDLIDPRVRSAAELEGILGFPPLGATLSAGGRIAHEALRRIALGIVRERRTSGVRTFVLTPVRAGAGTSTLALELAQELSDLGVRTAAIDANSSAPDTRYAERPGSRRASGQATMVPMTRPTSGFAQQIKATGLLGARNHAVVRANQLSPERYSICQHAGGAGLAFAGVRDSVELALETHDIVLLDAPPLLTSADPVLLMQIPAGAILVVRSGRDEMAEIIAAARELEKLAPPVVGAVLNTNIHRNGG